MMRNTATHTRRAMQALAVSALLALAAGPARAVIITTTCADASACTLQELIDGNTMQVNDKIFEDWFFEDFGDPAAGDVAVDPADILVTGLDDGGLDPGPGLLFTSNALAVTMDQALAFLVEFVVITESGLALIKDNTLRLGQSSVGGDGEIVIDETVFDAVGNDIGNKFVQLSNQGGIILQDRADFAPQSEILVSFEVDVSANGGSAMLDGWELRFSQVAVPEPATLALIGLGLAGLAARRRRTRA